MSGGLDKHLRAILKPHNFKKGEIILKEGQICKHIFFIESGLVRVFHFREGKEVTSWILKEGDIFISVFSFFEQRASYEYIEALEDCKCWGIEYEQLTDTIEQYPEFSAHQTSILREYYERSEERRSRLARQSPEERYAWLLKEEAEFLLRVPMKILATYLELPDRSFKRGRKKNTPSGKRGRT